MWYVLGIDPGLDGALSLSNKDGEEVRRWKMPLIELAKKKKKDQKKAGIMRIIDEDTLVKIIDEIISITNGHVCAYLEKVSAMPGQGVSTMFKLGEGYGIMRGVLAGKMQRTLVHPATWTKEMHSGVPSGLKSKGASLYVIKQLYPKETFYRTEGCRTFDDGFVDARLISEYGRRLELPRRSN